MQYWLETDGGEQFPLQGTCTIGRLPENTMAINDGEVSRRHAIIHAQGDGGYYMVDLGSRNGTILNGQRMRMPAQLKDNDRIQIEPDHAAGRLGADGRQVGSSLQADD